jgi:hypothetical protein
MNGVKADNLLGRTSFSPWDMRYPHCVGRMRCRRSFSLVSGLPSRLSAVGCPPLFEPLIGTTPKSDSWPACLWVSRLSPFPTGLPPNGAADADQVSRFSCMMFLDVRGVSDCAGPLGDFVLLPPLVLSSLFVIRSTPWTFSFTAQYPARPSPVYASPSALSRRCKTRGQDGSLLLSCKTLAFSTSCRFIPAHNEANLAE